MSTALNVKKGWTVDSVGYTVTVALGYDAYIPTDTNQKGQYGGVYQQQRHFVVCFVSSVKSLKTFNITVPKKLLTAKE